MIVGETGGYLYPSTVTGFKGKINCLNIGSNAIYIRQGKAPDGCAHSNNRNDIIRRAAKAYRVIYGIRYNGYICDRTLRSYDRDGEFNCKSHDNDGDICDRSGKGAKP